MADQAAPDRPALPLTAPDFSPLEGWPTPGAPIALRLSIDATGAVQAVDVVECQAADLAFARALAEVLRHTPHIPARRLGEDVASVKLVRLSFGA